MGLVHSNFHIIGGNGAITKESAHFAGPQDLVEAGSSFLRKCLLGPNPVNPPSAVIRKEGFSKVGGFSKAVQCATDFEYWMRISMHYDVMYLGQPFIKYRMYHNSGWTSSKYLTTIDGIEGDYSNFRGLQEEYAAKRIILQQIKGIRHEWKSTDRLVRKNIIDSRKFLIEKKYIEHDKQGEALRSIVQFCRIFPDLMFGPSMTRLIMKALAGQRMTRALKGLLGRQAEGV